VSDGFLSLEDWQEIIRQVLLGSSVPDIYWKDVSGTLIPYGDKEKIFMRFKGSTENRKAPILGAEYWKTGVTLTGKFVRSFPTQNGECYEFEAGKDLTFNGAVVSPKSQEAVVAHRFCVGAMKGFMMAVADAGVDQFRLGDVVKITCTGAQDTGKASDMVNFEVEVDRPGK